MTVSQWLPATMGTGVVSGNFAHNSRFQGVHVYRAFAGMISANLLNFLFLSSSLRPPQLFLHRHTSRTRTDNRTLPQTHILDHVSQHRSRPRDTDRRGPTRPSRIRPKKTSKVKSPSKISCSVGMRMLWHRCSSFFTSRCSYLQETINNHLYYGY